MLLSADALDTERPSADVCIVGAGAAGIALALTLAEAGAEVIVLEAGGRRRARSLYAGETDDPRHLPPDRDRCRGLGGTTAMWGGRCMPYDPIDFEPRPWLGAPGWPFGPETLAEAYARAQSWVDCGSERYRAADAGLSGRLIEGFDSGVVETETLERWSPPTHFGKTYRDALARARRVRVVEGAIVTALVPDPARRRVRSLEVRSPAGRRLRIAADRVVLAGGGLETCRLLLQTAREGTPALGDHAGWLGRGYMTHIAGVVARLVPASERAVIFGFERDAEDVYVRRRFTLSAEAQRRHELLNMYALLDRPLLEDASHDSALLSLAFLAKRLLQRQSSGEGAGGGSPVARHLRNLLTGAPEALSVLPRFGRERFLAGRRLPQLLLASGDGGYHLYFHAEQSPDRASRVRLSDERDAFGNPRLRIDWRACESDARRIVRAHELIDEELRRAGAGRLEFLSEDPVAAVMACRPTLGHHIGLARMAGRAEDGVVDTDCRVFGVDGLHLASAAVLPTSSQAHPTLTVVALALRLADHLSGTTAQKSRADVPA